MGISDKRLRDVLERLREAGSEGLCASADVDAAWRAHPDLVARRATPAGPWRFYAVEFVPKGDTE